MKFIYTTHFNAQIKERRITKKLAQEIYFKAEENYKDILTGHNVAISNVRFNKKYRKVMVAYDIIDGEVHFITSYPLKEQEIVKRVTKKRWIYEKN